LQQPDGRHPGIGIEGIHQAGTKKIDWTGLIRIASVLHGFVTFGEGSSTAKKDRRQPGDQAWKNGQDEQSE
jgi:hypothetical protein